MFSMGNMFGLKSFFKADWFTNFKEAIEHSFSLERLLSVSIYIIDLLI